MYLYQCWQHGLLPANFCVSAYLTGATAISEHLSQVTFFSFSLPALILVI